MNAIMKYWALCGGAAAALSGCGVKTAVPYNGLFRGKAVVPYNVLFLMADDMKPALGCYGDTIAVTPALDGLAADGILYSHAYCQQAVSGPSRASLLTGRYPDQTGVLKLETGMRAKDPDIVTLPQAFREAGYTTASVGKVFHGVKNSMDAPSWSWRPLLCHMPRPDAYVLAENKTDYKSVAREFSDVDEGLYYDVKIREAALTRLDSLAAADSPFFLAVGFNKPHLPWSAPEHFLEPYRGRALTLDTVRVAGAPAQAYRPNRELIEYQDVPSEGPIPMDEQEALKKAYYACASFTDDNIGRLLGRLKDLGLYDNTLVVFLGDHGYHHGEQGLWCKSTNFEPACNAPLIIKLPARLSKGKPSQQRSVKAVISTGLVYTAAHTDHRPVSFVDLMPTLCKVCGIPVPEGAMGEDLLTRKHSPYAFSQIAHTVDGVKYMGYAVRDGRWNYVAWFVSGKRGTLETDEDGALRPSAEELYDLSGSPYEKVNVLDDNPETAVTLREALSQHLADLGFAPVEPAASR